MLVVLGQERVVVLFCEEISDGIRMDSPEHMNLLHLVFVVDVLRLSEDLAFARYVMFSIHSALQSSTCPSSLHRIMGLSCCHESASHKAGGCIIN